MFWICAENSVGNAGMLLLLLSRAYRESRPFPLLNPPLQQAGWGCTRSWEGTPPGQLTPADQRDVAYCTTPCSAYKAGGRRKKKVEDIWSDGVCLPKKPLRVMETCFSGDG